MNRVIGVALSAGVVLLIVGVAMRFKMSRNLVLGSEMVNVLKLPA